VFTWQIKRRVGVKSFLCCDLVGTCRAIGALQVLRGTGTINISPQRDPLRGARAERARHVAGNLKGELSLEIKDMNICAECAVRYEGEGVTSEQTEQCEEIECELCGEVVYPGNPVFEVTSADDELVPATERLQADDKESAKGGSGPHKWGNQEKPERLTLAFLFNPTINGRN